MQKYGDLCPTSARSFQTDCGSPSFPLIHHAIGYGCYVLATSNSFHFLILHSMGPIMIDAKQPRGRVPQNLSDTFHACPRAPQGRKVHHVDQTRSQTKMRRPPAVPRGNDAISCDKITDRLRRHPAPHAVLFALVYPTRQDPMWEYTAGWTQYNDIGHLSACSVLCPKNHLSHGCPARGYPPKYLHAAQKNVHPIPYVQHSSVRCGKRLHQHPHRKQPYQGCFLMRRAPHIRCRNINPKNNRPDANDRSTPAQGFPCRCAE